MIVKICGITNQEDASAAIDGGASAIGFNFYGRSPRYIAPSDAGDIRTATGVRRVGVFVNETRARVEEIARLARLDVAQLHGEETVAEYPEMTVWKAVRMEHDFDLAPYENSPAEAAAARWSGGNALRLARGARAFETGDWCAPAARVRSCWPGGSMLPMWLPPLS